MYHWKRIHGALKKNKTGGVSLYSLVEKYQGNLFEKTILNWNLMEKSEFASKTFAEDMKREGVLHVRRVGEKPVGMDQSVLGEWWGWSLIVLCI